jgi:hypothetical protein
MVFLNQRFTSAIYKITKRFILVEYFLILNINLNIDIFFTVRIKIVPITNTIISIILIFL